MDLIIIGVAVVVVLIIIGFVALRSLQIAKPSEALVIAGKSGRDQLSENPENEEAKQRVVFGRAFINPFTERAFPLSLASRQVSLRIEGISENGIKLHLTGVAQVKVGGNEVYVRRAAQRFLDQQNEIDPYTQETLSGSLRSIVGTLTVESIIKDRASFAGKVKEEAEHSMNNQGLMIDTFQIQSVDDDTEYLSNLGRPEAAKVARNADIAEANTKQESSEAAAIADEKVAEAEQRLDIRRAELKRETDARQAEANAAGPLAKAEQDQAVILKDQDVAERRAELRERELNTEVRKPADAQRYKAEQEAAAGLAAAQADADADKARGEADADVIRRKGEAEAAGIRAQADAYSHFNEAAVISRVLETLPDVAKEIASPMSAVDNMTVISRDGAGQVNRNVATGIQETLQLLKDTTGLDVVSTLNNFSGSGTTGPQSGNAGAEPAHVSPGDVAGAAADAAADAVHNAAHHAAEAATDDHTTVDGTDDVATDMATTDPATADPDRADPDAASEQ
ncbi:flotillin family protein [Arthrobacter castelli]|uniref:flotillin family protein n=1 Tax=Arthrobacter castelli TaxID=271431 RepID=UPI00040B1F1B|nr:flotillin family protein [Arthrobacter castelli]